MCEVFMFTGDQVCAEQFIEAIEASKQATSGFRLSTMCKEYGANDAGFDRKTVVTLTHTQVFEISCIGREWCQHNWFRRFRVTHVWLFPV
ncbi:hypothetical protein WK70_21960 [Burkholderia cepacia]|nr:hypothetical protein WK70_21960 [Burkholderia cepacia]